MAKTPTWQRKAGQNPKGGLNEAGRRSLKAAGHDIKRPQPEGGSRRDSFCARMKGMKAKLTSAETANDPDSRINKSLRAWNCHADGGAVRPELGGGGDALKAALNIAKQLTEKAIENRKYPIAPRDRWYGEANYDQAGGRMSSMSPDQFLSQARPLKMDELTRENVDDLKSHILSGGELDPLKLYAKGLEDGRHRAIAAKELGIDQVPVINFRPEMGGGGDALKAAMKVAQNAIRAYHGSSHKFDKFDINKIGTGVGGNLRGNGLYFSAEEPIAREYRDGLSQTVIGVDGRPLPEGVDPIVKAAARSGNSVESFMDSLRQQRDKLVEKGFAIDPKNPDLELDRMLHELQVEELGKKINALEPYAGKKFGNVSTGHMYEVDINTSPEKLLDWDKPYHQQSEHVRNVLDELKVPVMMRDPFGERKEIPTPGFLAYSHLGKRPDAERFGATRASDTLKEAGIPGITYSDDLTNVMSKPAAASNNPQNYVMFDPSLIDILRRYGQGGEVRPEMGAGGSGVKAAVKLAQDIIKAYHGSPHKFDKFDISKIGTGEGAQAYGHGLYFADNENVARSYRDALGRDAILLDGNKVVPKSGTPEDIALAHLSNAQYNRYSNPWAIADKGIRNNIAEFEGKPDLQARYENARNVLANWQEIGAQPTTSGHMYEVAIRANPENMLDWDKSISNQRNIFDTIIHKYGGQQSVLDKAREFEDLSARLVDAQKAPRTPSNFVDKHNKYLELQSAWDAMHKDPTQRIGSLLEEINKGPNSFGYNPAEKIKGSDFYRAVSPSKVEATKTLLDSGIPGIKYLDQGSRGTGEGSSNYVVFDPSLIDIMRRYADGGRIHFDEGGLARIEELLRQAKGEEQATQASHPVGMSGNVEFAPVEIDEPLTGSKIPLGSLPAPTAAVVNPVANILAQYGPYAMGPIPAGMAAARDLATGIKEGSGLDVATAAMGAPGKMAKYGLPALGAVTDLLSPTEAQAGAGSKLVKGLSGIALRRPELFRAEHPYFPEGFRDKIAGIVSPFSSDEDIAKAAVEMAQKYRTPLENKSNITGGYYGPIQSVDPLNVTRKIKDIPGIKLLTPTPEQTYEDLYKVGKGGTLVNLAGDRSDFGRLTHIGGKKLDFPVDLHAGPKYSLEPNPGEVWANDPSHAGKLKETVAKGEEKGPVIGLYTPMGPQSISSSQHMFEALMAQIKSSGASKEDLDAFDKVIRSGAQFGNDKKNAANAVEYMKGNFGKNKQIGPWPGLSNPKEAAEWAKNLPGHHRAAIVNEMEKARWKKLGFPEVGVTRVALTDPSLMSTPQNLIGGRASMLSSTNPRSAEPLFQHSTYGSPTYGQYLMDLPYVQRQYAMPEAIKKYTSPTETGTVVHPFSEQSLGRGSFRKLFETNFLTQPINQEWLDTIMTGLERQKQYGFNKGGKAV